MKKQYISPETLSLTLRLDRIMQTGSVTVQTDTDNPINVGEDAEGGTGSDSRRHRDIWADEEEDEDLY